MNLLQILAEIGLDRKRGEVYAAALELSSAPAQDIAIKANVKRTTCYSVLRDLEERGLVARTIKDEVIHFVAQPPAALRQMMLEKEKLLTDILPQLELLRSNMPEKPRFQYFEGAAGLRAALRRLYAIPGKSMRGILSMEDLFASVGKTFMDDVVRERVRKKMFLRVVRSAAKEALPQLWPTSDAELREVRYAPEHLVFSLTTYIVGDTVLFLSTKQEGFAMLLESKELAATQGNLFEALWEAGGERIKNQELRIKAQSNPSSSLDS